MDNNSNLLEMNGESYQRLFNRGGLVQHPLGGLAAPMTTTSNLGVSGGNGGYESPRNTTPNHFLNSGIKPLVPSFNATLNG